MNSNDLIIHNGKLYCQYKGNRHKGNRHKVNVPRFYREFSAGEKGLKIYRSLLTAHNSEIKNHHLKKGILYPLVDACLTPVLTDHDPKPHHTIILHSFSSLESVQWHLIAHGFADHWLNPSFPYLFALISDKAINDVWEAFQNVVKCPRWGVFDLTGAGNSKQLWNRAYRNQKKKNKENMFRWGNHGCSGCIEEHGVDAFMTCCRHLQEYRLAFLKLINQWMLDTIQDTDHISFYENPAQVRPSISPLRKHLHVIKQHTNDLEAYVVQKGNGVDYVFRMIFDQIQTSAHTSHYEIKTVYGIACCTTSAKWNHLSDRMIWDETERRLESTQNKENLVDLAHLCHTDFWPAKIKALHTP